MRGFYYAAVAIFILLFVQMMMLLSKVSEGESESTNRYVRGQLSRSSYKPSLQSNPSPQSALGTLELRSTEEQYLSLMQEILGLKKTMKKENFSFMEALPSGSSLHPSICSGLLNDASCLSAVAWHNQRVLGDGCRMIFLDVGSNIAMHVCFLYEPELYKPRHPYDDIFDQEFGVERSKAPDGTYCAIGFEPNPAHRDRHQKLAEAYARMGWRYRAFFAGAGGHSGGNKLTFFKQDEGARPEFGGERGAKSDWGFSIKNTYGNKDTTRVEVPILDLALFVNEHIGGADVEPEKVVMKMDIEASEYVVLPHMFGHGSFAHVNLLTVEWHSRMCPVEYVMKYGEVKYTNDDC